MFFQVYDSYVLDRETYDTYISGKNCQTCENSCFICLQGCDSYVLRNKHICLQGYNSDIYFKEYKTYKKVFNM